MIKNRIPILLTSSVVVHDTGVKLTNTDERIHHALESVAQWLKIEPTIALVLCDGSGFDFSKLISEKFPHAQIECLSFENNKKLVQQFGRGYGEGEIVRYALMQSKLIAKAECFAKCTSKLWVENYAKCITNWNGNILFKGVFLNVFSPIKKTNFLHIDTRFYIINTSIYKNFFLNAHLKIDQENGYGLEECFYDIYLKNKFKNSLFKISPTICGVGGGTAKYYKNSNQRKIKEDLRNKLVKFNKNFKDHFSN